MPVINKHDLDAELRSQLNFEFIPIYEGGILSGESPAPPKEDGVEFLASTDAAAYVRFKSTPYMAAIADLWVYFSYFAGTSTNDFEFEIYYQVFPVNAAPGSVIGPIAATITPDGTTNLQTSITVINNNITAWRVPAKIEKNSFVRFEIVRKGSSDTNPDDLHIIDLSYATIPTYQTLAGFDNGLAQPCVPFPTGTNILSARGSLLTHDGITDIELPYPGDGKVLVTDDATVLGVDWIDQTSLPGSGGGAALLEFAPSIITSMATLTGTDADKTHFVNNPSLVSSFTVTLPDATTLTNGQPIAFYNLAVNPSGFTVDITPSGGNSLFSSGGSVASINLGNIAGNALFLRTDGVDWYNTNLYPEDVNAPFQICVETPAFPGDAHTFTLGQDALPPFYMFVNNVLYSSPTHFTVSGAGNKTWVWLDTLFTIAALDDIRLIYNCGGTGSGSQVIEQFTAGAAQTIFTLSQDAQPPFFFYVNGNAYLTPSSFLVSGVGNRTWTWLDVDFVMSGGEEVILQFFV